MVHLASCYDFIDDDLNAELCYREAQHLGIEDLPIEDQPGLDVRYVSTLRNNLKFAKQSVYRC